MARTLDQTTRREFLSAAVAAVAGVTVGGCAEDDSGGDDTECPELQIHDNHGHILEIPIEDIEAGETKSYTLEGTHEHTLDIEGPVFEKLKAEGEFTVSSNVTDGHAHQVTLVLDPSCLPGD